MDCFVACAPLRKRFAFVAGNDDYAFAEGRSATRADKRGLGPTESSSFMVLAAAAFFFF